MSGDEIIEKMMEIRATREAEIQANGMEGEVLDVKTLIPVKENETNTNQKFLVIEEDTLRNENGEIVQVVKVELYYDENGNKIGGNRENDGYPYPIPVGGKELSQDLKKDLIEFKEKMDLAEKGEDGIISLRDLEEMKQMILAELELEEIDIDKLTLIDLKDLQISQEELDKMLEEIEVDDLELEGQEKIEDAEIDDSNLEIIPPHNKLSEKDISSSAIIEANTYVNEYDTIASTLKVSDEGYVKFAVVQTSQLKESPNSSKYTFVGIRKDGSAQILDSSILQAEMDDMGRDDHEVTPNGKIDEGEGNRETFKINGTRYGFALEDEAGNLEVSLMSTGRGRNGNESVSVQINTYSVERNSRDVQELARRHPDDVDKGFEELKQNGDSQVVKTVDDIDGNSNTINDKAVDSLVEKLLNEESVDNQYSPEGLKKEIEKMRKDGKADEDIYNDIKYDAEMMDRGRQTH